VDCLGVLGGPALPGTSCNDNNAFTGNDVWDADCVCAGQPFDCSGIPGGPVFPGMACDDANPNTINDWVDVDCVCRGTGITDCNAIEFGTAWPGTPCDDGDPMTTTEVWSPNCVCTVPFTDCDGITFGYQVPGFPCDDGDPWTLDERWSSACGCDTSGFSIVTGRVFPDVDMDGIYGSGDLPVLNRTVRAMPWNVGTITSSTGSFFFHLSARTYELVVTPGAADVQSSMPNMVTVSGGIPSSGHDLPLMATSVLHDLSVSATYNPPPRPGSTSAIHLFVTNTGNMRTGGSVDLAFDPLQQFITSNPLATLNGNTLSWDLDTLELGEVMILGTTLFTPTSAIPGTPVVCAAQLTTPDNEPANDLWSDPQLVVASYDPNDIQVAPDVLSPQEVADSTPVTYTVRFQNTGTFMADHVRILDTLPAELNTATFTLLGSTHPCTALLSSGVLDLRFDHILLPDSATDPVGSNGSVTFRITPNAGLPIGTVVANRVDIYFDFNTPVRTNDAVFTVEQSTAVGDGEARADELVLLPNPASDVLQVLVNGAPGARVQVRVIDQAGRSVRQVNAVAGTALRIGITDLPDGLYTVQAIGDGSLSNARFVKRN
jgi:uncharacterized repeat protein (TIGR01451 family)